ncbi:magnesium-translocating P-type ATPase [Suicoccus acidiformans]|uniref:Magnesium-transporting ATPase, P-type 1 n=1 Tax=Suicoccus acidiformans TaxID=2036206 RepID=A0A347WJ08_9LACT|nr:magnesium-translocating P-type ATPase [Suicoccus acidiformans]AXY25065.1 magnesium-translocating P-type ATPase [Suicoccus acidiformans]
MTRKIWKDIDLAKAPVTKVLEYVNSAPQGLSQEAAAKRLAEDGRNELDYGDQKGLLRITLEAFSSPFTLVLIVLALISFVTEYVWVPAAEADPTSAIIIMLLVLMSGLIDIVQTVRSNQAAEALDTFVEVTSAVCRDGLVAEIPTEELVRGDLVELAAGDMIPADLRLIHTKDLFVSQTSLTGESYPVEKLADASQAEFATDESTYPTMAYMGSEVVSGSGTGVLVRTAQDTLFGEVAEALQEAPVKTSFDAGVESTSRLLIRFMLLMAPTVILINGLTKGNWLQALLFGISVAVGLTPEMLPMIVNANLVKGARSMADKGTIVKNLHAMQNFGAIDVLCTDKTGTLTQDKIVLQTHLNIDGDEDERVLRHAVLNSYHQTGLRNLMDVAIIEAAQRELTFDPDAYTKIDEIPFDFNRRRMSVLVEDASGKTQLITKGAMEEMLGVCAYVEVAGEVEPLDEAHIARILTKVDELNARGLRVIGLAQKADTPREVGLSDESEMVLIGYLAFLDPPKETTAEALKALSQHSVQVKILTGDNALVTQSVCRQVGLDAERYLSGADVAEMSEEALKAAVEDYDIFVKLNPSQKADLVRLLRENGHVVGFMGDGINDSPAMRAADVGISVDNAVDIAKESADIILLNKDLMVLEKGIESGRTVFGNIMKYMNATTSSNFGNMFSVLVASLCLPFLPMLPMQLLFLNLLYDTACLALPWDRMDGEYLEEPKRWDAGNIKRFMLWFGPTSSVFDVLAYAVLFFVICPQAVGGAYGHLGEAAQTEFIALFHTGWFVISLWTQTLVLYALRTPKLPFVESRPSFIMMVVTLGGILVGTLVPYTRLGVALDMLPLPSNFWWLLLATVVGYLLLVTVVKHVYVKRYGELL